MGQIRRNGKLTMTMKMNDVAVVCIYIDHM